MLGIDFLTGAGIKILSNVINSWFQNSAEERKFNAIRDTELLTKHIELSKLIQTDHVTNMSRAIIFIMITSTFSVITIYSMFYPAQTDVLIKVVPGFLSKIVGRPAEVVQSVDSSGIVFGKCFSILEMVIDAFTVDRYKR